MHVGQGLTSEKYALAEANLEDLEQVESTMKFVEDCAVKCSLNSACVGLSYHSDCFICTLLLD